MFIEHITSNVQSVMTIPPETQKAESAGFFYYYGGEIIDREKYGGLLPRHYTPE